MKVYTTFENLQDVAQKEDLNKEGKREAGNHSGSEVLEG